MNYIEERIKKYKERMRKILPQKKTKQQEYKNNKLFGNYKKQTLLARPHHWSYTPLANLVASH